MLGIAGLIGVTRRQFMNRGPGLTLSSAILFGSLLLMWNSFQGDYVRQLRVAYKAEVHDIPFPTLITDATARK